MENNNKPGCWVAFVHSEVFPVVAFLVLAGITVAVFFTGRALERSEPWAIALVSVLGASLLMGVGGLVVLAVMGVSYKMEEGRERREQARFRDNVQENLAQAHMITKIQSSQNAMLLRQARDLPRLSAPNGDTVEAGGFSFDEGMFHPLDLED